MKSLTPLGTARERVLSALGLPCERPDEPPAGAGEPDELEPAYFGWEIARCARGLTQTESVALAALAAACITSMRAGSTRVPLDPARLGAALALAGVPDALSAALVLVARAREGRHPVAAVLGRPGERKPLVIDGGWLYAERMLVLEERFAGRIRDRLSRPMKPREIRALNRAIASVESGPPPLTDEQKRAVREALRTPIALITGGPGTGKTTIVVALLRALAWLGERMDAIGIAAPTGKAAQRLKEAIATGLASTARDFSDIGLQGITPAPQTLHRLLGWSPRTGRFAHHENDPLPYRVVVVDEASMIDLAMMDRLTRALRDDARLVLLGDADQLPSIEAGAVFRDMSASIGAVRLTRNLRVAQEPSGRRIVAAAQAVNAGSLDGRFAGAVAVRRSVGEIAFEGVEHLAAPWAAVGEAVLDAWWRSRTASFEGFARRAARPFRAPGGALDPAESDELYALFAYHARARILCATRTMGAPASAQAINAAMLARLQGGDSRVALAARRWHRAPGLAPGVPVVVERNDYERALFNGDQGLIIRAEAGDGDGARLLAVFRRGEGFDAFPVDALHDVSSAFAMTVHKAQGSEFDDVLLVLPDADLPLLTRELVYTAVTRARRSVVLVGSPELLACAVSRVVERHCGVAEKLAASPAYLPER
jgi:exodeoxyribonuclease V alpha subunit